MGLGLYIILSLAYTLFTIVKYPNGFGSHDITLKCSDEIGLNHKLAILVCLLWIDCDFGSSDKSKRLALQTLFLHWQL